MSTPLHVLWIPSWYPTAEQPLQGSFFFEEARAIKEAGVDLGVLYPEVRPLREGSLSRLRMFHFQRSFKDESHIPTARFHGWNLFPKLLRLQKKQWVLMAESLFKDYSAKRGQPHLIHAMSSVWAGIAARVLSEKYGIPYVITEHRDVFVKQQVLGNPPEGCWATTPIRAALDKAACRIAVSTPLKERLKAYTKEPIEVLHNSVDTDFFYPEEKEKESPFTYVTVAHLEARKGVLSLIYAFANVHQEDPTVRLVIGGGGPEWGRLKREIEKLQLQKCVFLLGPLTREGVRNLMRQADAFVLPSQNESFGVVYIEAMAMGVPVIATRCGGPEEIVNREVGYLVEGEGELVKRMRDVKKKKFCKEEIRRQAISRFGRGAFVRGLLECYDRVLPQRRRGGKR